MAAELEQMFQDFILNKIREIEGQSEDKGTTGGGEADGKGEGGEDTPAGESSKKPKKHKKHKSKKKKKREKDSSSESEREGKSGTSAETAKDQGEENKSRHHKQHSGSKKKKKKKRRRKEDEDSSDSDPKQKDSHSVSVRRQEELPDIIPKQDSSDMGRGDSPSHSCSQSHSCSATKDSSPSRPRRLPTPSSSSEKKTTSEEPVQSQTLSPSDCLQLPQPAETQTAELQNSEQSQTSAEGKEMAGNPGPGASQSTSDHPAEPRASEKPSATHTKSPAKKKSRRRSRSRSRSPRRSKDRKSSKRPRRSRSPHRSHRRSSRSRSPSHRKRSRSRSGGRKSWRRSRSRSRSRRRASNTYSQRDRWKREPSHSPVLILRKNRTSPTARKQCPPSSSSPQRISDLDKEQLLEIAKANAAAMCAKAGMPIPASLRTSVLPLALPSMAMNAAMASMTAATVTAALSNIGTLSSLLPLPSITNKPPSAGAQPSVAALEEVKRKVTKQANSISIKEFTDKCRKIVDSTGELPVAMPHVSDEEEDGKPFGGATLREQKVISFSINNTMVRPVGRTEVEMAKEFPVSSGSQHRKKEGEGQAAYGEWVPVDKATEKSSAPSRKAQNNQLVPSSTSSSSEKAAPVPEAAEKPDNDVFPEPPQQPVDITQAVTERIKAQRRLAENPYDINAICMLSRAQEQVDAWAQSSTVPGLFTGSTGAQVLTSEELSNTGPQAWLKKDQFLRAAPVSGGVGEFLMRKMGWRTGEGLGRNREGTVEPIIIDFKVDRKGLVAEGEKPQKQTGGLVVTKDLMGKHPVSALIELCNKRRIVQPDFVMVHHSGPDHRKNFLFKVTVNGVDYQPQTASPNKKHAKAMAATVALQALGEVSADGPGLYTGPVFTAASTGPLFST